MKKKKTGFCYALTACLILPVAGMLSGCDKEVKQVVVTANNVTYSDKTNQYTVNYGNFDFGIDKVQVVYADNSTEVITEGTGKNNYSITDANNILNIDQQPNVGTYPIVVHYGDFEITLNVVVSEATITAPTLSGTYEYTGAEQTATLTGFDADKMEIVNNSNKQTNVGSYKIKVKAKDNYTFASGSEIEIDWAIAKAQITAPTLSGTYEYTGAEQTATLTGFDANKMEIVNNSNKQTNVGSYKIKVKAKDNYTFASGSEVEIDWEIAKAQINQTRNFVVGDNCDDFYSEIFTTRLDGDDEDTALSFNDLTNYTQSSFDALVDEMSTISKATTKMLTLNYQNKTAQILVTFVPLEVSFAFTGYAYELGEFEGFDADEGQFEMVVATANHENWDELETFVSSSNITNYDGYSDQFAFAVGETEHVFNIQFTYDGKTYTAPFTLVSETTVCRVEVSDTCLQNQNLKVTVYSTDNYAETVNFEDVEGLEIISGSFNNAQLGNQTFTASYNGHIIKCSVEVLDPEAIASISLDEEAVEIGGDLYIIVSYNDSTIPTERVKVTQSMITEGTIDFNTAGYYADVMIEYEGVELSDSTTIWVYDPDDDSVRSISLNENSIVWLYSNTNAITKNTNGLYLTVLRNNATTSTVAVTDAMVSYDATEATSAISSGESLEVTITYESKTTTISVFLISDSNQTVFENASVYLMQNGYYSSRLAIEDGQLPSDVFVKIELGYAYNYASYYLPLTTSMLYVQGDEGLEVFDFANADEVQNSVYIQAMGAQSSDAISAYVFASSDVILGISFEDSALRLLADDEQDSIAEFLSHTFVISKSIETNESNYSILDLYNNITLTASNFDFSEVDFDTYGYYDVTVTYLGYSTTITIMVCPDFSTLTPETYTIVSTGSPSSTVAYYDCGDCGFINMMGAYFILEEVDTNVNLYKLNLSMLGEVLVVKNDTEKTLTQFTASLLGGTPTVYTLNMGPMGSYTINAYTAGDKTYVDIIDDESGEIQSTAEAVISGNTVSVPSLGMAFTIGDGNVLTPLSE